jgi:hypothetical protein
MSEIDDLRTELRRLIKETDKAYVAYSKCWQANDFDFDNAEIKAREKEYYSLQHKQNSVEKKIKKLLKLEAAKHPVMFITWKRYGFRHISMGERERTYDDYRGESTKIIEGIALCGNDYSIWPGKRYDWEADHYDFRSTNRPLCGTCRKNWLKLTGEELK